MRAERTDLAEGAPVGVVLAPLLGGRLLGQVQREPADQAVLGVVELDGRRHAVALERRALPDQECAVGADRRARRRARRRDVGLERRLAAVDLRLGRPQALAQTFALVERFGPVIGFDDTALGALLEVDQRGVHHDGRREQRQQRDDQPVALRGMPQLPELSRPQVGRGDHRPHNEQRLDAGQVGERAAPRERPDDANRHTPGQQQQAGHARVALADSPPRQHQSQDEHQGPDKRRVKADQPEREGHPLGLPGMRREAQDIHRGPADGLGQNPLVPDDRQRQQCAPGRLDEEEQRRRPDAGQRVAAGAVEHLPAALERAGEQRDERKGCQAGQEEVRRVPGQISQPGPMIDVGREHGRAAGRQREHEQEPGRDDEPRGRERRQEVGPRRPRQLPEVEAGPHQQQQRQTQHRDDERGDGRPMSPAGRVE